MVTTHIHQQVEDYGKWRAVFDEVAPIRKQYGCVGESIYQSTTNPNEVFVILSWNNAEDAQKYVTSSDLRAALQRGGVRVSTQKVTDVQKV